MSIDETDELLVGQATLPAAGYESADSAGEAIRLSPVARTVLVQLLANTELSQRATVTALGALAASGSAAQAAADAAPAGWYADPAGRFELRYWDGTQWTEHVSRAGQQYTDPPVA